MRAMRIVIGATVAVGLAMALAACAYESHKPRKWNPNGPARSEDWHSPVTLLMKYDANHDGTLTRAELEAGLRAEFNAADKDHNGCLNTEEVQAINESRISMDNSAASPLMDWNRDGCVDFREYATTMRSLFEQLDADGNGEITRQESHQRKPRSPEQPSPHGGY